MALDDYTARVEPPVSGPEAGAMIGSLERQRATLAWKCDGLDAAGLAATVGTSSMTLGGLLKHLALVEDHYFAVRLWGRAPMPPFGDVDFDADPDWEWRTAGDDTPDTLYDLWRRSVDRSRASLAEALADGGLDRPLARGWPDGRTPDLRRMLLDLVEEYARHVGHADLLREAVDGRVGEDPPA